MVVGKDGTTAGDFFRISAENLRLLNERDVLSNISGIHGGPSTPVSSNVHAEAKTVDGDKTTAGTKPSGSSKKLTLGA